MLLHEVEYDVTTLQGVIGVDEGVVVGGSFEHSHEDGGVLRRQILGRTAEVGLAGGLDAEGVRAEVDGIGILRQDLILREEELELVGGDPLLALHDEHLEARDVAQQSRRVFGTCAEEVLGELLGDGGGASCIAMQDILLGHCCKGCIVDAVMMVEALVLCVDKGFPEHGVHLFVSDGCAVLAEELANQLAIGTVDHRGCRRALVLDGRHGG